MTSNSEQYSKNSEALIFRIMLTYFHYFQIDE